MATTAEIAKRYFDALARHDLDAVVALWAPGGIERFVGQQELTAPAGVREVLLRAVRRANPITGNVREQLELAASALL